MGPSGKPPGSEGRQHEGVECGWMNEGDLSHAAQQGSEAIGAFFAVAHNCPLNEFPLVQLLRQISYRA